MGNFDKNYRIGGWGACLPPLCETQVVPVKSDLQLAPAHLKVFNYWLVKLKMDRMMKYLNNQIQNIVLLKESKFRFLDKKSQDAGLDMFTNMRQFWLCSQIWGSFGYVVDIWIVVTFWSVIFFQLTKWALILHQS